MKKLIFASGLVVLLVVGFVVLFYQSIHNVDMTLTGVQCRLGNEEYSEAVTVKAKGTYRAFPFREHSFEGVISISNYQLTQDVQVIPMRFRDGKASISYSTVNNGKPEINMFATLSCTPDFHNILILISEPVESDTKEWNGENGLFVCAPADSHQQALEMARAVSTRGQWLSQIKWK